jgi:hypothetical protein
MLKLKRYSAGQWFDYPKAPGVKLLIRPLHLTAGLSLRSKVREKVVIDVIDPKTKRLVSTLMEDIDSGRFSWEVFNYMLEDFEGISMTDDNDKVIEVSQEELKRAIFDDPDLRDFVGEKSEFLREQGSNKLEGELKNSPTSQSG